jgi:RNA polymerase sigma-70 factor (ECF subfamily)
MEPVIQPLRHSGSNAQWDRAAFDALFRAHYSELCAYVYRMLRDRDAAEEAVQGVFLRLCELGLPGPARSVSRSYLYAAVRNAALNAERARRRVERYAAGDRVPRPSQPIDAATSAEYRELVGLIGATIEALPPRRREVFLLSRRDGLDYAGIARVLGLSVKTVESQMGHALTALRRALDRRGGVGGAAVALAILIGGAWTKAG